MRSTSWSSAAATAGSRPAAELARRGRSVGAARRPRPRLGRQHPQRRDGAARAEGRARARSSARHGELGLRLHQEVEDAFDHVEALVAGRHRLRLRAHRAALPHPLRRAAPPTSTRSATSSRRSARRPTSCGATTSPPRSARRLFAAGLVVERSGGLHPARFHAGLVARRRRGTAPRCTRTRRRPPSSGAATAGGRRTPRGDDRRRRRAGRHQRLRRRARARAPPAGAADGLVHHRHRAARAGAGQGGAPDRPHVLQRPQPPLVLAARRRGPDGLRRPQAARAACRSTRRATTSTDRCSRCTRSSPACAVERAWGGNVALTLDRLPHCGRIDGLWYATGCNGSGVALNTWLGHRMAGALVRRAAPRLRRAARTGPSRCTRSRRAWLPVVSAWFRFQDRRA